MVDRIPYPIYHFIQIISFWALLLIFSIDKPTNCSQKTCFYSWIKKDEGSLAVATFAVEDGDVVRGELCFGLDAHQEGGPASGGDNLPWEVLALECEGEGSLLQTNAHRYRHNIYKKINICIYSPGALTTLVFKLYCIIDTFDVC